MKDYLSYLKLNPSQQLKKLIHPTRAISMAFVLALGMTRTASAQTYGVVYAFTGTPDGAGPVAGVVADTKGNLYGTTLGGGKYGLGTAFKIDKTGKETVLYNLGSAGSLVLDKLGNLYGTTVGGGNRTQGSVFKIDQTGKETDLYVFTGAGGDGSYPKAGLVRDTRGNLYGTTQLGGNLTCMSGTGCGTVFKVDATGKETVLHKFTGTGGMEQIRLLPWCELPTSRLLVRRWLFTQCLVDSGLISANWSGLFKRVSLCSQPPRADKTRNCSRYKKSRKESLF